MTEVTRIASGVSALFGAWVLVSAFVLEMSVTHYWNAIVVGAAVVLLGGYAALRAMEMDTTKMWTSVLAGLLGLWLIASPFVYEATDTVLWSAVISGIAIAALSGYSAYAARRVTETTPTETART